MFKNILPVIILYSLKNISIYKYLENDVNQTLKKNIYYMQCTY